MRRKPRRTIVTIVLAALSLFTLVNMNVPRSKASDLSIDLFTQNEPYSGRGQNMPSDAFGPGEVVDLNALVTLNNTGVQNLLVTFEVTTPTGASFTLTSATNSSGVAFVNFTIPAPSAGLNESELFGTWKALANTMIGGNTAQDTLTFLVDWVIQILSVETIAGNLSHETFFGIGGDVGFEITLRSVSMRLRNATIAITVQDELGVPINFSEIDNFEVQPNGKLVHLYARAQIPVSGPVPFIGNATATVSVLDAPAGNGGTTYGPPGSATFFISPFDPIQVAFHNVAVVDVNPSARSVNLGEALNIKVTVNNQGTEVESFNASAYFGDTLIGTANVSYLRPYIGSTINFPVNTSIYGTGNFTLSASIPALFDEADLTDNNLVDGNVYVAPRSPLFIHNVAITSIELSNSHLHIGDILKVTIGVLNKGNSTETFDVTAYYNSSPIGTQPANALAPMMQTSLVFSWNTSSVPEGTYQITASAPLANDIDPTDNTYVDGTVSITKPTPQPNPPPLSVNNLFIWLLFLLLILLLLLIALLYRRAKRDEKGKRTSSSFSQASPPCFEDMRIDKCCSR